jgi:hypothetical protein
MPVEAVHLSGLVDSLATSSAWVRRATSGPYHRAARLGALFVDLPYFDRFSLAVARYALRQPQAPSTMGSCVPPSYPDCTRATAWRVRPCADANRRRPARPVRR